MTLVAPSPDPEVRRSGRAAQRRSWRDRHHDALWAALLLLPTVVAIAATRILPALEAVRSSLFHSLPGGLRPAEFVGLDNYVTLLSTEAFRDTLVRTVVFNLVINPLQIGIALLVAVLFVQRLHLRGLWRTLVFVPCTIPIVGSSIAWGAALGPDGPVNALLAAVGLAPQPFLTSADQALACIILIASWIGIGYWMMFLIAGLQEIPAEYYEAAKLDRAGPIRTFFSITLPLLRRPLLFVLVADTVANFVLFVPVQMLTGGGPESSTSLLMFDAYRTTFGYGSRNLGAAEVVILTVIMLVIVALQFRLLREDKGAR
ncbi:MAG TPA: sugar ABC transporter permease [Pseudonocardia sp.]|nr:sugar ABC transporter permease [Pseudonocardia sp.]